MRKLWQTTGQLNKDIESFTVGDDYRIDQQLIAFDIEGSLAHAHMLLTMGVISKDEFLQLQKGLREILQLWKKGKFLIKASQEDCHTAIEQFLTEHYGEVGKKIHTGRSRNDQALTMLRLFMKTKLNEISKLLGKLEKTLRTKAVGAKTLPMPGYTHMQKAMPATIAMWLESFADGLRDQKPFLEALAKILDQSPLGSAAGFGIKSFPAKRDISAKIMQFGNVQKNPMYCGLSRGHFEHLFLQTINPSILILARLVNDLLLFSMQEFGLLSLPDSFTTGSSIMPQKRNYDVLELMRGKIKLFLNSPFLLQQLLSDLMSGYNRDLQLTKKIFVENLFLAEGIFITLIKVINKLKFNEDKLRAAMTEDLYETEKVYKLVRQGIPFRTAYAKIKNASQRG